MRARTMLRPLRPSLPGALALLALSLSGCGSKLDGEGSVSTARSALLGPATNTTNALISTGISPGVTLTGGNPPYTCVVTVNNSSGGSCSVNSGTGVVLVGKGRKVVSGD